MDSQEFYTHSFIRRKTDFTGQGRFDLRRVPCNTLRRLGSVNIMTVLDPPRETSAFEHSLNKELAIEF
jgi:hypothetical protein